MLGISKQIILIATIFISASVLAFLICSEALCAITIFCHCWGLILLRCDVSTSNQLQALTLLMQRYRLFLHGESRLRGWYVQRKPPRYTKVPCFHRHFLPLLVPILSYRNIRNFRPVKRLNSFIMIQRYRFPFHVKRVIMVIASCVPFDTQTFPFQQHFFYITRFYLVRVPEISNQLKALFLLWSSKGIDCFFMYKAEIVISMSLCNVNLR